MMKNGPRQAFRLTFTGRWPIGPHQGGPEYAINRQEVADPGGDLPAAFTVWSIFLQVGPWVVIPNATPLPKNGPSSPKNGIAHVINRMSYRVNASIEQWLPEQRLFLKSDTETRFIRLRPATQAIAITGITLFAAWSIATAIVLMDWISAGSTRDQAARQQATFEERLNTLSVDRDIRADEAARAQERFNLALEQVSDMQGRLLASEDRRRELETGIDVIQNTLRRTIEQRDEARTAAAAASLALAAETGTTRTDGARANDAEATLAMLTDALGDTATERDRMETEADRAAARVSDMEMAARELRSVNDEIFTRLEEAVTISMEPLDNMFRAAGMSPEELLDKVRSGYSGQGGPLSPLSLSTSGALPGPDEARANAILEGLDRMNLYRLATEQAPLAMPVTASFRWTSGFGMRRDPKGWGNRMHDGVDLAGSYGTPILATGDGTVIHAGWDNGYGRSVEIRHINGIVTRYAHMAELRVDVGQNVSRGQQIGDMGNSGRSTGTHLHYEILIGGSPVNPMTFIKAGQDVF
jgi:murein DD-endopeptidase MepM/ murein hydrolase activator NlpD